MWLFFSVAALAAAGLCAFRWFLDSRPAISRAEYAQLVARMEVVEGVSQKAQNAVSAFTMGRRA